MNSQHFIVFSLQISLMLSCGLLCGLVMRRLHQPAVLGEMLGGILLGPTIAGALFPEASAWIFPVTGPVATVRGGMIQLGMLLFILTIGLELDLATLRKNGIAAILVGCIGTFVPLFAGVGIVYALPRIWGIGNETDRLPFAMFIGACLANSANPVLARILAEIGNLKDRVGAVVMAATTVDDLVGWSLLAVIVGQFDSAAASTSAAIVNPASAAAGISGGLSGILSAIAASTATVALFFAGMVCVAHWVVMPLLRKVRQSLPWPSAYLSFVLVLTLLTATLAESLGLHAFLGPFLLGIGLVPTDQERAEAFDVISRFVMSFFVPIYFVSMGLTCNFAQNFDVTLVSVVMLVACASKISSSAFAAWLGGFDPRTSLAIGCGMNARGAVGVILAGIGLQNGVIKEPTYVALVLMALGTSMLAGPLMQRLLKKQPPNPSVPTADGNWVPAASELSATV